MFSVATEAGFKKAGVSRYAINVVAGMARRDPSVRFECYVTTRFERPPEWQDLGNVRLHEVKRFRTHRYLAGWRSLFQSFDAWFVPAYDSIGYCPVPQVAMIHDLFPLVHPEWFSADQRPVMKAAIERACRVSRVLLANSESTKSALIKLFPRLDNRIRVTPLGVGNLAEARDRASVDRAELSSFGVPFERFVLTLGTLEPRKNLPRLLRAWSKMASEFPDLGLVIGGGKGWEFDEVFREFDSSGLKDRVAFLDYVPDGRLPALFAGCEVFVLASLDEGFGLPVLEAMHYGAPLALSDRGALPEVAGDLAVYFDPESVDDMVETLRSALDRGPERDRLVQLGRERAREFTWEVAADLTLKAIREACGERT